MENIEQDLSSAMREAHRRLWEQASVRSSNGSSQAPRQDQSIGREQREAMAGGSLSVLYSDSRISAIEAVLQELRTRIGVLEEDDFPEDAIGGDLDTYRSHFRVVIDSDGMIAVTNGADSATEESKCGAVKVNGQRVDVLADFFAPGTSTTHYIWLHTWIDSDGVAHAEIIDGDTIPPDNPNAGIGHGSQLLARVAVDEDGVATITQDYLRGGEHLEIIAGDCNGGAIAEAE